jgi:hypothetical protein
MMDGERYMFYGEVPDAIPLLCRVHALLQRAGQKQGRRLAQ